MSTTGSHQVPASAREREVIEAFRAGGVLTRARIAETTGLGRSTVSAVLTRLTDEGVIAVVGHEEHDGRGRPTERLAVVPDAVRAIGIDLAHGAVRVVALNVLGETLAQEERAHEDAFGVGPRHRIVHELLAGLELPEHTPALRGIGLGVSGPVSFTRPERAPWRPLVADLTARHGVPVQVDNTTRFAAFAEHMAGAEDRRTTLHVRCYQGVGGAVVREGALDLGAAGMAGEVGHLPVEDPGMTCRCGRSGCLETVASTPAVLAALSAGDVRLPIQCLQPGGVHPHAIVRHCAGTSPILRPYCNGDMAALGIVDDTVANQIVQHPSQKGGVALHPGRAARMLLGKFQFIPFRQTAVEHLAHRLPPRLRQIHRLPADGLEGVFQLGGQVQILHQRSQPLPLPPDHPGLVTGLGWEGVVVLQLAGVAQHHGQGRADVMGHPSNPLRPGVVLLHQVIPGPVQPRVDLRQFTPFVQRLITAQAQALDALQDGGHGLLHPAGVPQHQEDHQQQVAYKDHDGSHQEHQQGGLFHGKVVFH